MKENLFKDVTELYDQNFKFLEQEGITDNLPASGPNRAEYQNMIRTTPEKFLLKDNLLLLLKNV